jgi:hypothetical protein
MTNRLISMIYKSLILYIKSFKLINSFSLTSLFILYVFYILLFISLINEDNLLIKVKFISDIISFNIKLNKRIV